MTPLEGVEDISRRASHWYDPNVVDALRALHGMEPLPLAERPLVPRRITAWNVLRSNPGFARLLAAIGISGLGDPLNQVAALVSIYAATGGNTLAVAAAFMVLIPARGSSRSTGMCPARGSIGSPTCHGPTPALLTRTESASPVRRRCSAQTRAAVGERQMLPLQTKLRCTSASLRPGRPADLGNRPKPR